METTIKIFQRGRYANDGLSASDNGTNTATRENENSGIPTGRTVTNPKGRMVLCTIKFDKDNESGMAHNIESIVKDWETLMRYAYGYTADKIKTTVTTCADRDGEEYLTVMIFARVKSLNPSGLTAETLTKDIADLKNRLGIITENTLIAEDVVMNPTRPRKIDPITAYQLRKRKCVADFSQPQQ